MEEAKSLKEVLDTKMKMLRDNVAESDELKGMMYYYQFFID